MSVELALLALPVLALVMLVPFAGRIAAADGTVQGAAAAAARAASLQQTPTAARAEATSVASASIDDDGIVCRSFDISVDTSAMTQGGSVSVTVRCRVSNSDLLLVRAPGDRRFEATAHQTIDTFRGDGR